VADKPEELKEHTVLIGGVEHTLLLSDEDAEKYEKPDTKAKTPANKARAAKDK
jgi:hypothetical protein